MKSTSKHELDYQFLVFRYIEDEDDLEDYEVEEQCKERFETIQYVNFNNISSFDIKRYFENVNLKQTWCEFELSLIKKAGANL